MAMSLQIWAQILVGAWLAVPQTQRNHSMKSSGLLNSHFLGRGFDNLTGSPSNHSAIIILPGRRGVGGWRKGCRVWRGIGDGWLLGFRSIPFV